MKKIVLALILFSSVQGFAGNDFAGGFLIQSHETKPYELFDFFEYGLQNIKINPYPDLAGYNPEIKALGFSATVTAGLVHKLNQVYKVSPEFANHIFKIMTSFTWTVLPQEIKRIEDIGWSPIDTSRLALIPVALRNNLSKSIFITSGFYEQLTVQNKVGLIFHEALSQYFNLITSSKARALTAFLFSNDFDSVTFTGLETFMVSLGPAAFRIDHRQGPDTLYGWRKRVDVPFSDSYRFYSELWKLYRPIYSSFEDFNPQICREFEKQYEVKLKFARDRVESAWQTMNQFLKTVRERELAKYSSAQLASVVFISDTLACESFDKYNGSCSSTHPSVTVRVRHYQQKWITKEYEINWADHLDYEQLKSDWQSYQKFYREMLDGPKLKCNLNWDQLQAGWNVFSHEVR